MLDFLACQSLEKLVIDAEIIGMVKRLLKQDPLQNVCFSVDIFRSTLTAVRFCNGLTERLPNVYR